MKLPSEPFQSVILVFTLIVFSLNWLTAASAQIDLPERSLAFVLIDDRGQEQNNWRAGVYHDVEGAVAIGRYTRFSSAEEATQWVRVSLSSQENDAIALANARQHLEKATALFLKFNLARAREEYQKSLQDFRESLSLVRSEELADAHLGLGVVMKNMGHDGESRIHFKQAALYNPRMTLSKNRYAPSIIRQFSDLLRQQASAAREPVMLIMTLVPDVLLIDGREFDPKSPIRLAEGVHLVQLRREGFAPFGELVRVRQQAENKYSVTMKGVDRATVIAELSSGSSGAATREWLTQTTERFRDFSELVVCALQVQPEPSRYGCTMLDGQQGRAPGIESGASLPAAAPEALVAAVRRLLARNQETMIVATPGIAEESFLKAEPLQEQKNRWWLWGGLAALLGGGLAAYIVTTQETDPPTSATIIISPPEAQ